MSSMTALVARRAVLDYARRPLNLVLLVVVPIVLVFVWGGTLADFSKFVGGTGDRAQIKAATAGWAAAALAGLAGFFRSPVPGRPTAVSRPPLSGQRLSSRSLGRGGRAGHAGGCGRTRCASSARRNQRSASLRGGDGRGLGYLPLTRRARRDAGSFGDERGASSHPCVGVRRLLQTRDGLRDLGNHPTVPPALPNPDTHRAGQRPFRPHWRRGLVDRVGGCPVRSGCSPLVSTTRPAPAPDSLRPATATLSATRDYPVSVVTVPLHSVSTPRTPSSRPTIQSMGNH